MSENIKMNKLAENDFTKVTKNKKQIKKSKYKLLDEIESSRNNNVENLKKIWKKNFIGFVDFFI